MLHFCTLFNSKYLSRGLALYQSLTEVCKEFTLTVYAFDDLTYSILTEKNLINLRVVSLKEFENEELLKVKPTRTPGEYCWTCTPAVIKDALSRFELDHCTYLDADLYFYKDPKILIDELISHNKDVLITPHNYTWIFNQEKVSGKYCVQFMYFNASKESLKVLNKWYFQCLEWCYNKQEYGKFGDQKYLDHWPQNHKCVHSLKHTGALAPWNINSLPIEEIVFYHYHGFTITGKNSSSWADYPLPRGIKKNYINYQSLILNTERGLESSFDYKSKYSVSKTRYQVLKQSIKNLGISILLIIKN